MSHCLLFDSDGTLVDSEAINTEALADELALHNIAEDKTVLLERYRGWQFRSLLDDLAKHHRVDLDERFEISFRCRASRYFDERLEPVAHIKNALRLLKQARCVASNAPMTKLEQVLGITDLAHFFHGNLFSAYDISAFKPAPQLFLHAASQMGYPTDKCIVVEDSEVGVQAAIAAGMKCVHYVPDQLTVKRVERHGVLVIDSMIGLPDAIETLEAMP